MAVEAGKGAADESGVGNKTIVHRDFAAVCRYLQVSRPPGRETGRADDRTARTRHREAGAGLGMIATSCTRGGREWVQRRWWLPQSPPASCRVRWGRSGVYAPVRGAVGIAGWV